jgi:hypothetical protein
LETVPWVAEKNVYSAGSGWNIPQMAFEFICSIMHFKVIFHFIIYLQVYDVFFTHSISLKMCSY